MNQTIEATQEMPEATAAISPLQQRINDAYAKYQDGPGPLDITFGKVGDRFGFFVTMEEPADLKITVSCPLIPHAVTFAAVGIGFRREVHAGRVLFPQEIGVSINGCYGKPIRRCDD